MLAQDRGALGSQMSNPTAGSVHGASTLSSPIADQPASIQPRDKGQVVRTLKGDWSDNVSSLGFSADGKRIVANRASRWRKASSQQTRVYSLDCR